MKRIEIWKSRCIAIFARGMRDWNLQEEHESHEVR